MAITPEGAVKQKVKKLLRERGIWFFMPMQSGFGVVGIPDFIACWNSKFLAIETKAPGKRANVSANQEARINEIRLAKGLAVVVDDVSQLEELLGEQ